MNLFGWVLIGHLVGDFLLQTRWMAMHKSKQLLPLLVHSLVYTAAVAFCALPAGGLSITGIVIIFFAHVLLDRRVFVTWWLKNINKSPELVWLQVMVDQTFHLLILAIAVTIASAS